MRAIYYVFGIVFAVIAAPFVAFALGVYTFFITFIAFVEGFHIGLMNNLYDQNTKKEPQDIWEKHIKKMEDKTKPN